MSVSLKWKEAKRGDADEVNFCREVLQTAFR